jgi:hypothetical protein
LLTRGLNLFPPSLALPFSLTMQGVLSGMYSCELVLIRVYTFACAFLFNCCTSNPFYPSSSKDMCRKLVQRREALFLHSTAGLLIIVIFLCLSKFQIMFLQR